MAELVGATLAVAGAMFIAIQVVCIRVGTTEGRSNDALVVVLLVNIGVLVPVAIALEGRDFNLTPMAILAFAGAGFVGTMLGRAFEYAGIERIGASRSEPIKASQPLHAALMAVIFLGESLTPLAVVGILLVVGGVAALSWESANAPTITGEGVPWRQLLFPLAAAFFFGIEPILAKVGFAEGTPVFVGLAVKTLAATIAFGAYLRARQALPDGATLWSTNSCWYVAAGIANTFFLISYYIALDLAPVVLVVPVLQTSPLFVILLSAIFLRRLERVTWRLAAAAIVVVAGAAMVSVTT